MTSLPSTTDPLLQPFRLGRLTLRNRIFSSSHAPAYNTDGTPSERYAAYHEEKAKGGIAMTMIGGSSNVSADSASLWGQLDYSTNAIVEPLGLMVDRIHQHGTAVMSQLTHMGRRNVSNDGDWLPLVAPSSIREPMHRCWPKEMEHSDIRRIVSDFAAAAQRARDAGLDGVELCATSHLIDQFWTPLANQRTDEYGGSLDNRLRFAFEVIDAIRDAVGHDLLLGIRMIGDEDQPGGLRREESAEIATRLAESGSLDFLNVTSSSLSTDAGLSKAIPPSGTPLMPYVSMAAAIKETVDIPVLHATRVTDLSSARHAIEAGLVDLVGMTRAHIADPHIVAKLERGDEARIRVCVGASHCINRLHLGMDSLCLQNPATGRESFIPQLISPTAGPKRRVVVVGAGPAGLEASRVCAERGHDVVLFEAQGRVGGQVVLAARASERQDELAGIIGWLEVEVLLAGADVRLNSPVDASDFLAERPDIVIVATGGSPDTSFLDYGSELANTTSDVLSGSIRPTGSVLIFDDRGSEPALSVAEFLAVKGVGPIELVTPDRLVGHDLAATIGPAYLKMLYEHHVVMTTDHRLVGVERRGGRLAATLRNEHTEETAVRVVDRVVTETGVVPNDGLYRELRGMSANRGIVEIDAFRRGVAQVVAASGFMLFRVGDAVAGRDIAAAIFDSRRLCQDL